MKPVFEDRCPSVYVVWSSKGGKVSVAWKETCGQLCIGVHGMMMAGRSYGVMVSTLDFESSDPGSNPGRSSFLCVAPKMRFWLWCVAGQ